jgi:hypothetical protein
MLASLSERGVERVEVVDDRDAAAVAKQRIHQVAADEAGSTGDQHVGASKDVIPVTMRRLDI